MIDELFEIERDDRVSNILDQMETDKREEANNGKQHLIEMEKAWKATNKINKLRIMQTEAEEV